MATKVQGPDRGWSWVIAFGACINSLILDGIFRTSGVLFVAFIHKFGVSREEASWPIILCISVFNLTGIVTGGLAQRFGVRPVFILGSVVATAGISSCYFATSFASITVLFGVVFGAGYGLCYILISVMINQYFLKHRASAHGIATSGACFGSLLFPPLFEFFIDKYDLSGCFLLTGGIVFHLAITGVLMRPAPWLEKAKSGGKTSCLASNHAAEKATSCKSNGYDAASSCYVSPRDSNAADGKTADFCDIANGYDAASSCYLLPKVSEAAEKGFESCVVPSGYDAAQRSLERRNKILKNTDRSSRNSNKAYYLEDEQDIVSSCPTSDYQIRMSNEDSETSLLKVYDDSQKNGPFEDCKAKNKHLEASSADDKASNSASDRNNLAKKKECSKANSRDDITEYCAESSNGTQVCIKNGGYVPKIHPSESSQTISACFKKVLTCPMFYVTTWTFITFYTLFSAYVVIIIDYSLDCGIPENDTKYILFAFALSDLFGRLFLGWITDRQFVRRQHYIMLCMALMGLVFFCFPAASSFSGLVAASCGYGLLLGCTIIMFPILLVDFLGIETNAVALGCMSFLAGLATFGRPFLIGYFRDNLGSYSNTFYVLGGISLATSFLWLLENCFVKRRPQIDNDLLQSA